MVIFAETPSGSQSASGMKNYGVSCFLIAVCTPAPLEVTPQELKKNSVGTKNASKAEIIEWAYGKHPEADWHWHGGKLQNKNEHIADAIALIYAGMKLPEFKRLQAVTTK